MELTKKEMYDINGGGISWLTFGGIGAAIIYIIGIISGYSNPIKCGRR